jgi:hypothetical protein
VHWETLEYQDARSVHRVARLIFFCAFAFVFFDFNTGVLTLGGGLRGMIGNWRHTCWSQFGSKHKV